jgi:4-hydroxy-tetrahydrodipicolinate synthase
LIIAFLLSSELAEIVHRKSLTPYGMQILKVLMGYYLLHHIIINPVRKDFFSISKKGLFQHFKEIATICPIPLIIYNVPGRTACNLSAETCLELAHGFENIVAVKEASGDLGQIMRIIKKKPESFSVISGDDMLTIPIIAAGGAGVISVLANAFPMQCNELVVQSLKNNFKSARKIHFQFLEMIELLFIEGNPSGVKAMLKILNICQNNLRLPLVPVSIALQARIQKAIEEINKS